MKINRQSQEYVSEYIENSVEIEIEDIKKIEDIEYSEIYTGLNLNKLNRSKLSSVPNNYFSFYSSKYNRYFRIFLVSSAESMTIYGSNVKNTLIKMKINQSQLNDPNYGTRENPIPVLYLDIPKYKKSPHYWMIEKTPEEYRESVYYYLAYIMPKDEFKERFSSVNN
jgi:hypothetical protein